MDFADGTLVALAEELDCTSVFTTDRRKVIIPPNSPSPGVVVASIEESGAPVELPQFQ